MAERKLRWVKRFLISLGAVVGLILILVIWFFFATRIALPKPPDISAAGLKVTTVSPGFRSVGRNWLQQGNSGLWEMYLEGKPFDRGVINGKLSELLIEKQEQAFTDRIREMVPSDFYLRFLKYFIFWFNRDLDKNIPEEYKLEIYGISLSASDKFSFIGNPYQRMLNYHSAHDIGHALQDFALVGCTSFGAWGGDTKDGSLIIGRNFDFFAGDEFAENKIVCFEKPESGIPFMMVTWGGMIGTVSGMNMKGLTVTINAAKSETPYSARTPISILAREILQYAGNISEAWAIAQKRETFVSESIMVGSAADNKAAIIEKSPFKIALVMPVSDNITCANHFQSQVFEDDQLNISNKLENASVYRQKRLRQKITNSTPLDVSTFAAVLRDQKGLNEASIGMGNEKAINQLIAHHSVIFQPSERLVWVSAGPWQIGSYACYDLCKIFNNFAALQQKTEITETGRMIPPDPFLNSAEFNQFLHFKQMRKTLTSALKKRQTGTITGSFLDEFKASNTESFEVYALTGDYYFLTEDWAAAAGNYRLALQKVIPRWSEKEAIIRRLADCNIEMQINEQ